MHPKSLLRLVAPLALASALAAGHAKEAREWTARNGHRFSAELLAVDGLRATLGSGGAPKWIVPLADLAPGDAESARAARTERRRLPLIDARLLATWPAFADPGPVEVRATGEDAGQFRYESAHFAIHSDLKLPVSVARDLALAFEGTRAALIALPLGLHAGGEREKYSVLLAGSTEAYQAAGGPPGSGGFYDGRTRRTLVSLPNLGVEEKSTGLQLRYASQLFILKHEITHQLLARWHGRHPFWLHEGLPEFIASLPYSRGRYTLQNPGAGMRDYLLKWRRGPSDRAVRLIPPERLMRMDSAEWNAAVREGAAYDFYNSANLLTYYFIQQRGGAPLAGFIAALRRGELAAAAEKEHLLGAREPAALAAELIALGRRLGLEIQLTE